MTNWCVVSAVNNEQVLRACLLASPGLCSASDVFLQRGAHSAAAAYNDAILNAKSEIVVVLHQDMYLPAAFPQDLDRAIDALSKSDPHWGVVGVWGLTATGEEAGHVYCTAGIRMLGHAFDEITPVRTLDEVVLVVRRESGLRFDSALPGFHLYGTDLCLEAERQGMRCYAMSAFCIHNSNSYTFLPWSFWRAYRFLRTKWRSVLPVRAPCTQITRWCIPPIRTNLGQLRNVITGRVVKGRRVAEPGRLCEHLMNSASLTAQFQPG